MENKGETLSKTEPDNNGKNTSETPGKKAVKKSGKSSRDAENGLRLLKYRRFSAGEDYEPTTAEEMNAALDIVLAQVDKQTKLGRPPIFEQPEELMQVFREFISYVQTVNSDHSRANVFVPDIEGFALYAGTCRQTLHRWETTNYKNFCDTIKFIKNALAFVQLQLGKNGKIPPLVLAMVMNNCHDYTQKQEITLEARQPLTGGLSSEEIARKYNALPDSGTTAGEIDGNGAYLTDMPGNCPSN